MNNKPKIIILNCPPRTGKDTIADLFERNNRYTKMSFKQHLFDIAYLISGLSEKEWHDRYQQDKDTQWDKLGGLSQRNYLIKISEDWIKPLHGEDYFGKILSSSIHNNKTEHKHDMIIIPDGGFNHEIKPLVDDHGEDSILILQWTRLNYDFTSDSRDWITDYPKITKRLEDNNDTIINHYNRVYDAIKDRFYVT